MPRKRNYEGTLDLEEIARYRRLRKKRPRSSFGLVRFPRAKPAPLASSNLKQLANTQRAFSASMMTEASRILTLG